MPPEPHFCWEAFFLGAGSAAWIAVLGYYLRHMRHARHARR